MLSYYTEEEDWDPAPGGSYSYTYRYKMNEAFATFFGLEPRYRHRRETLQRVIIEYALSHNGINTFDIIYDETLWNVLGIPHDTTLSTKKLDNYIIKNRCCVRTCPICGDKKVRDLYPLCDNQVCETCAEPFGSDTNKYVVIQGIKCHRPYYTSPVLEAIVYCPLCKIEEVTHEKHLGAFCKTCAHSEELKDANGNRVHFEIPGYYDYDNYAKEDGYIGIHYENGEIIQRFHQGEFPCFFRGVECVAEDISLNNMIVVRFRNKESEALTWEHVRLPIESSFADLPQNSEPPTDSDWITKSYPRWAAYTI